MAEPEPRYTAGEAVKLAALLTRGSVLAQKGKSTAEVDRKLEELKARAWRRMELEDQERRKVQDKRDQERAAKRAARRFW